MLNRESHRRRAVIVLNLALIAFGGLWFAGSGASAAPPRPPKDLRLYIFDCGTIHARSAEGFSLKNEEVASTEMSVPCYLIVHPKGTLMWDAGLTPDQAIGKPTKTGAIQQGTPLVPQLAAVGYAPGDITYLGLSHFHGDHVSNANLFTKPTWLVRKIERDHMFSGETVPRTNAADYKLLKDSKTILIDKDEYDVFGDGKVVIKSTPGHTPGHQALFLKFKKTGPVVLSGDLYHHPEERTLNRLPINEFNKDQTAASRAELEVFMKKNGAQLWIQHDIVGYEKLKKAPAFYE